MDKNDIGKNIRYFRKMSNLSQKELAEKVGISINFIKQIESNGKLPSLETFVKVCSALDISSDYLLQNFDMRFKIGSTARMISELSTMPSTEFESLTIIVNKLYELKKVNEYNPAS